MAEKSKELKDDSIRDKAQWDSWDMYEKVRYAPIHGHAPVAPTLTPKPSPLGAIFGAVGGIASDFEIDKGGLQYRQGG